MRKQQKKGVEMGDDDNFIENGAVVDCDALAKIPMTVELNGREIKVINNALILLHSFEPDDCTECINELHNLITKFQQSLEHALMHIRKGEHE